MAQQKEHLDEYLGEARSLPSLYTSQQLQQLIIESGSDSERSGDRSSTSIQKQITIMSITLTLIAGSIYGLLQLLQPAPNPIVHRVSPVPARNHPHVIQQAPFSDIPNRPSANPVAVQASQPVVPQSQVQSHPVRQEAKTQVMQIPEADIPGMRLIRLSRSEAEQLGITFREGEIGYYERYGRDDLDLNDPQLRRILTSLGVDTANPELITRIEVAPNGIGSGPARNDITPSPVAPLMVSNLHPNNGGFSTFLSGRLPRGREFDAEFELELLNNGLDGATSTIDSIRQRVAQFQITVMDKLVPIIITPDESGESEKPWEVILWYYPTPEFLALLPAQVRDNLETELSRVESLGERSSQDMHPGGTTYLDVWRAQSGAITKSQVFPVPAVNDELTLRYTLDAARFVSITLHDINGRRLKDLIASGERATGTWEEKVSVADLQQGIYLLSVNTDRGEHAVQRIVVR